MVDEGKKKYVLKLRAKSGQSSQSELNEQTGQKQKAWVGQGRWPKLFVVWGHELNSVPHIC